MSADAILRAATDVGYTLDAAQLAAAGALERAGSSGVYLWGPVGRGKSWLMDTYLHLMPAARTRRFHFHDFFSDLHTQLHLYGHRLDEALDRMVGGLDVVCFDEFSVDDPADGIFARRLLDALLARSTRLILTSNQPPQGLMPNPLFHSMFEPTIALIETSLRVVEVNGPVDYRTITTGLERLGFAAGRLLSPSTPAYLDSIDLAFPEVTDAVFLDPLGHSIRALRLGHGQVWFDFDDLCATPTSPADYAAVAANFPWWVISGVPTITEMDREPARRFAHVVDVLYDRSIRLDLIVEAPAYDFLSDAQGHEGFARTTSRLHQLADTAATHPEV